jgi:hypothetical protein
VVVMATLLQGRRWTGDDARELVGSVRSRSA